MLSYKQYTIFNYFKLLFIVDGASAEISRGPTTTTVPVTILPLPRPGYIICLFIMAAFL